MQDRPTCNELLDAVREFIETDVVTELEGRKKFHARVAANVLAIVGRELQQEGDQLAREWRRLDALLGSAPLPADPRAAKEALPSRNEELSEKIRSGEADGGAFRGEVLAHLRATVREKLEIANPRMLAGAGGADGQT